MYNKIATTYAAMINKKSLPILFASIRGDVEYLDESRFSPDWIDDTVDDNNEDSLGQLGNHRFDDHEKTHLYRYSSESTPLNKSLVYAAKEGIDHPSKLNINSQYCRFTHDLDGLDAAINKHKLTHPLVTYTGVTRNPSHNIGADGLIHLPAYTSTSIDPKTAHHYAVESGRAREKDLPDAHIIKIRHNPGDTGAFTDNNPELTPYIDESEFTLPRGVVIRLSKSPKIYREGGKNIHVWEAERVHTPVIAKKYSPEESVSQLHNKDGVRLNVINHLGGLTSNYGDFGIDAATFHAAHVESPVLALHTPSGRYIGMHDTDHGYMFHSKNGNLSFTSDKVLAKYPELSAFIQK